MGKPIAVIDFVTTTPVGPRSKPYPFPPDRVLFEDYEPQTLISGIARTYAEVKRNNESISERLQEVATKIDNFVLITFTVIAVLFAAVTIFVTRTEQASVWNPALFLVSLTAIFISAAAWMRLELRGRVFGLVVQAIVVLFLLVGAAYQIWDMRPVQQQINQLRLEVDALKKEKQGPPAIVIPQNNVSEPTSSAPNSGGAKVRPSPPSPSANKK
jgi:cell division protein FtsL